MQKKLIQGLLIFICGALSIAAMVLASGCQKSDSNSASPTNPILLQIDSRMQGLRWIAKSGHSLPNHSYSIDVLVDFQRGTLSRSVSGFGADLPTAKIINLTEAELVQIHQLFLSVAVSPCQAQPQELNDGFEAIMPLDRIGETAPAYIYRGVCRVSAPVLNSTNFLGDELGFSRLTRYLSDL